MADNFLLHTLDYVSDITRSARGFQRITSPSAQEDIEKAEVTRTEPFFLPSGTAIFTTFPDLLFIPELVLGMIVFSCTVASTFQQTSAINLVALVISLVCFLGTLTLMVIYATGAHTLKGRNIWTFIDVFYHLLAAGLYTAAGILIALKLFKIKYKDPHYYDVDKSATVSAIIVTLIYSAHAMFSLRRKISDRAHIVVLRDQNDQEEALDIYYP